MLFKSQSNKVTPIKFYGDNEEKQDFNNYNTNVISKRIFILMIVLGLIISLLSFRLYVIQISNDELYSMKLETYGSGTYTTDATRGEIVDRNYTTLVQNENEISATYYATTGITDETLKKNASILTKHIKFDMKDMTLREKKDYFILSHPDEAKKVLTASQIKEIEELEESDKKLYNAEIKALTEKYIKKYMTNQELIEYRYYYLMSHCSSGSVNLVEGLSIKEASYIGESSSVLKGIRVTSDWKRDKVYGNNFSQVLGKVTTKKQGIPTDQATELLALGYSNDARVGTTGIEAQYETILKGQNITYSVSTDDNGNPSINVIDEGENGANVRLTIDWELQEYADKLIESALKANYSKNKFFRKMFFIMMDPNNGDILVMSGKQISDDGKVSDYAAGNYLDANRIGSTTKGASIYTYFKEGILTPNTYIKDEPLYLKATKAKKSWKTMGNINEIQALAQSSNVYMWKLAIKLGGSTYVRNGSLSIDPDAWDTYRRDIGELGLGVKTGLDVPNEALGQKGQKSAGNFLDEVIGQYDTYTMVQLVQYVSTLANRGIKVQPRLYLDSYITDEDGNIVTVNQNGVTIQDDLSQYTTAFTRIAMGYRACVTSSNGTGHSTFGNKSYTVACKSGTAEDYSQSGNSDNPNHLMSGWAPYEEPQIAFACLAYRQKNGNCASQVAGKMLDKYFEKYGDQSKSK